MAVQKRTTRKATSGRAKPRKTGSLDGLVARETASLLAERAQIAAQIKELGTQLGRIESRIAALTMAKAALEGKTVSVRGTAKRAAGKGATAKAARGSAPRQRRGKISARVLDAISSGKASTRAELIKQFGYDNDKPGQVSISNALSQLNAKNLIKHGKARGEWRAA